MIFDISNEVSKVKLYALIVSWHVFYVGIHSQLDREFKESLVIFVITSRIVRWRHYKYIGELMMGLFTLLSRLFFLPSLSHGSHAKTFEMEWADAFLLLLICGHSPNCCFALLNDVDADLEFKKSGEPCVN